jgi:hypothetical protein
MMVALPQRRHLLLAAALCGCTPGDPRDGDPAGDSDQQDTGPVHREIPRPLRSEHVEPMERLPRPAPPLSCDQSYLEEVEGLPEPEYYDASKQILRQVVRVETEAFPSLCLSIYYPSDPSVRLYDEGSPVVAAAPPSLKDQTPGGSQLDVTMGLIEVEPLYPGWTRNGCTTSGNIDVGGEPSAAAVRDAVLFAAGVYRTSRGHSLGQLVGRPVCNDRVPLLGASSGAGVAHRALATWPEQLAAPLLGLALFEAPATGQFAVLDTGAIWKDGKQRVDSSGNGIPWDDGSNPSYEKGACASYETCELDYSTMRFDKDLALGDVYPNLQNADSLPGLFYLDGNGNGALDLGEDGGTDMDGDGGVDPEEDFVFLPLFDTTWADTSTQYFSSEVAWAAKELELFDESDWPAGIATPTESDLFWSTRTAMPYVETIAGAYPDDFRVTIGYSQLDHGPPHHTHPHIWVMNHAYLDLGTSTRLQGAWRLLQCVLDPAYAGDFSMDLEPDVHVPEDRLHEYALPEDVPTTRARAVPALALIWDHLGSFDRCWDDE